MPVFSPGTTPYLNPYAPQADRVIALISLNEGSGTTAGNAARARFSLGNGTITSGAWVAGGGYDFSGGASNGYIDLPAASGADIIYPEGTIVVVFSNVGSSASNRPIFTSTHGSAFATTHGAILCQFVTGTDTLRVSVRDQAAGVTRQYDWASTNRTNEHTLIIRWGGPDGVLATLDGTAPTTTTNSPSTYKGPLRTVDTRTFTFGRNSTPEYGLYILKQAVVISARLTDAEVTDVLFDPYTYSREPVGLTTEIAAATSRANTTAYTVGQIRRFSASSRFVYECVTAGTSDGSPPAEASYDNEVVQEVEVAWIARVPSLLNNWTGCPWIGRADTTQVVFRFTTSPWMVSSSVYLRVKCATTTAGVSGATPVTSSQVTTSKTVIDLTQTGLSAGTLYYFQVEYSTDNVTWYPVPAGLGTFRTRRTSGDFTFNTYSDDHLNTGTGGICPSDIGWNSDIVYAKATATANSIGYRNRFAAYRTAADIVSRTAPDFLILMGDNFMFDQDSELSTADDTSGMWQCARSWTCFHTPMMKRQAAYQVPGNHEAMCGYKQYGNSGSKATQKQAFNVWRKVVCNPTSTTYAQGGESANTSGDWVGSGISSTYLHDTSLELNNYWGMTWGGVDFFFLDYCRYTDPGETDTAYRTVPNNFKLGNLQLAWLINKLAASTANVKIIVSHALDGGISAGQTNTTGYYSRGSGTDLNRTEPFATLGVPEGSTERTMQQYFRAYGVTMFLKGHDHKAAVVQRAGVYYVTCPTAGAPSHAQSTYPGWVRNSSDGTEWSQIADTYGTAQSLGLLDSTGADHTTKGMIGHYNVMGYFSFSVTSGALSALLYETCVQTIGNNESDLNKYILPVNPVSDIGYGARFIANQSVTPSSFAVDLSSGDSLNASPLPIMVTTAILDSAYTGAWYAAAVTERYGVHSPATWQATETLAVGAIRVPTKSIGYAYIVSAITTGQTGATEPTFNGTGATDWPTTIGSTVVDSGVTWTCAQRYNASYRFDERLYSKTIYVSTASAVRVAYAPRVVMSQSFTTNTADPSLLAVPTRSSASTILTVKRRPLNA